MIYGYCRVSTKTQNVERQIRAITAAYPDAVIIEEKYTGTTMNRPLWERLYKKAAAGDTIVFDSVSRMSRDAAEGFQVYRDLFDKGVTLVFLNEQHISTDTYKAAAENRLHVDIDSGDLATDEFMQSVIDAINKYIMRLAEQQIRLAFDQAEKEVADNRKRTKGGIETARLNGKQIGQRPGSKLNVKKAATAKEIIKQHSKDFDGTLSDPDVMKLSGVSRNSYYKYKRELKGEA